MWEKGTAEKNNEEEWMEKRGFESKNSRERWNLLQGEVEYGKKWDKKLCLNDRGH